MAARHMGQDWNQQSEQGSTNVKRRGFPLGICRASRERCVMPLAMPILPFGWTAFRGPPPGSPVIGEGKKQLFQSQAASTHRKI